MGDTERQLRWALICGIDVAMMDTDSWHSRACAENAQRMGGRHMSQSRQVIACSDWLRQRGGLMMSQLQPIRAGSV
ncbi:unnamed protein product, partial [Staurois parvus]